MISFPFNYQTPLYRPPSEARSLLLQVTLGCSHNHCTFCAMYRTKSYSVRPIETLLAEIDSAADYFGEHYPTKVFLCDGDALGAPMETLLPVLEHLNKKFPQLKRVGIYATAPNILEKSKEELELLAQHNLTLAYLGLESGCDQILKQIVKGNTAADMISAAKKLKETGWQSSVIAMLGLGGRERSSEHVQETAKVVSKMAPQFFSFLTTVSVPGTPYDRLIQRGGITPLTTKELLVEMHDILAGIYLEKERVIFRANHVSNQFPVAGTLPRDTPKLLKNIEQWIFDCPEGTFPQTSPSEL